MQRRATCQPEAAVLDRLAREYAYREILDESWAARPVSLDLGSEHPSIALHDPGGLSHGD